VLHGIARRMDPPHFARRCFNSGCNRLQHGKNRGHADSSAQ
jgi:hypothetical protein